MPEFCHEHVSIQKELSSVRQKTVDNCRATDQLRTEVHDLDVRVNKRITEMKSTMDQRIDDKMESIKKLFWVIMVSIIGSMGGFILFVMHLYDKIEKLPH